MERSKRQGIKVIKESNDESEEDMDEEEADAREMMDCIEVET